MPPDAFDSCDPTAMPLSATRAAHATPAAPDPVPGQRFAWQKNQTQPNRIEPFDLLANSQLASRNGHPIRFGP